MAGKGVRKKREEEALLVVHLHSYEGDATINGKVGLPSHEIRMRTKGGDSFG